MKKVRANHDGERYAQSKEVKFASPRNCFAEEQNRKHGNDHAYQMPFQLFQIMDLQPARQRQSVVHEQRVQTYRRDVGDDGDQKYVDGLDQAHRKAFAGAGRDCALQNYSRQSPCYD
jgi:hypothetical protein